MKFEKIFNTFIKWILFLLTGAMTLIVLLGVVFRYILEAPLPWSEELSRYLMVWGASLGAAVAFKEGSHVAVTLLSDRFHGTAKRVLEEIAQTIVLIFMVIVMVKGFALAYQLRIQTSPALEIPMMFPYLAIPVSCLFIVFDNLRIRFSSKAHPVQEGESQ